MKRSTYLITTILLMLAFPMLVFAASSYDEATDGDLSGDGAAPTALTFSEGSNTIAGMTGGGDRDYATFTVPEGMQLDAIVLDAYQSGSMVSFIGIANGTQLTGETSGDMLGYFLFGSPDIGTDVMPAMGMGENAQGFTGVLPAGEYTVWIQELADATTYTFDFQLSEVDATAVSLNGISAETTPVLTLIVLTAAFLCIGTLLIRTRKQ